MISTEEEKVFRVFDLSKRMPSVHEMHCSSINSSAADPGSARQATQIISQTEKAKTWKVVF